MRMKAEIFFTLIILVILSGMITATFYVFQELIFKNWESEQDLMRPIPVVMPEMGKVKNLSLEWINDQSLTYQTIGFNLKLGNIAKTACPAGTSNASPMPITDCYILNYTFQSCQKDCYGGRCLAEGKIDPKAACAEPGQYRLAVIASPRGVLSIIADDRFNELSGEFLNTTSSVTTSIPVIKDAKQPAE